MPDTVSQQQKQKQKEYEAYVKKITPTHSLPLNMSKAFLTGGIICTLGQFILNTAKYMGADKEAVRSLWLCYSDSLERASYRL